MIARLIFNLKERLTHPRLHENLVDALKNERRTVDELHQISATKLKKLLSYAIEHVPYYRQWAKDKNPSALTLKDFPILTKSDIRGHEREFISDEYEAKRLTKTRTSGSTGEPFVFFRERTEWDASYAALWRGLKRFGIRAGDKRVLVKGVDEIPTISSWVRIRRKLYGWLNRCIVIDAHFLAKSEENIVAEINRMIAYRPDFIHGYASSIDILARTAKKHGIDLSALGIKAVVTESEKCHKFQRELIEDVFKTPVVENYGCVEFGMIAQPAEDNVLCINDDHVCVETDADGNAILTNLDAWAFPLIRFKNGDRLSLGKLHSKLPYHTILEVDGRVAETIRLPCGGCLQGYIVMYPISKHMSVLRAYQVYQPDINHLKIRLMPSEEGIPLRIQNQILHEMLEITGSLMNISIEIVKDIPLTKRGKRTFVISDVKQP